MNLPRFPSRQPAEMAAPNRRRFGRFAPRRISCSLGRITNLSARGMRIERRSRLRLGSGREIFVFIRGLRTELKVKARVIWTERLGFMRYAAGLEFRDVSTENAAELARLAHNAALTPMYGQNAAVCDRPRG